MRLVSGITGIRYFGRSDWYFSGILQKNVIQNDKRRHFDALEETN